ncbi:MAG: dihydrodipicolinate reductase C-terminal domain-containing protein [Planctomycetota bacterium]
MKLGVFGKGRLGSAVARAVGAELAWNVTRDVPAPGPIDCAIEASAGAAVQAHLTWAIETQTPLVIASTGFHLPDLERQIAGRVSVLLAPNLSITVALFDRMTAVLARFAAQDARRDPYLVEQHHARKLDAPGGTAKLLARTILASCPRKTSFTAPHADRPLAADELSVSAIRAGASGSSHTVGLLAPGESIEFIHRAHDYSPYGEGAVVAAHWLAQKQAEGARRVYSMADVTRDLLGPLFEGLDGRAANEQV